MCGTQDSYIAPLQGDEVIDNADSFSQLPDELILYIFGYLNAIGLAKCGACSRKWQRMASNQKLWDACDLRKLFPSLKVFDTVDWVTHAHVDLPFQGLSVADVPPLDKRTAIPALQRCLSSLSIEGNAGVTLLTIPQGLNFKKLVKLTHFLALGNLALGNLDSLHRMRIWRNFPKEFKNEVKNTYRIVITNNVLKGSRRDIVQQDLDLLNKIGCRLPKAIGAMALLFVTFMTSRQPLYKQFSTFCLEKPIDACDPDPLVASGVTVAGYGVKDPCVWDHGYATHILQNVGYGAVRRL